MINHITQLLNTASDEELRQVVKNIESVLNDRAKAEIEEAKAKTVVAIHELMVACKKAGVYRLGSIFWECDSCDSGETCFDLLQDDVLEDVAKILKG